MNSFAKRRRSISSRTVRVSCGQVHWGQLQEWAQDWDDPADTHRHVSHLFGVYPGRQITPDGAAELCTAARRSLELRGDGGTGWAMAWKVNLWARLGDGDHAYRLLAHMLTLLDGMEGGETVTRAQRAELYPNLFDAHPPFQIDGNFGLTSGTAEMLLQSQAGEVHLLPALPAAWPCSYVRGLRARGGVTVEITWQEGRLQQATLHATRTEACRVRTAVEVAVSRDDGAVVVERPDQRVVVFTAEAGRTYTLTPAAH